jgi:membrane protease YdiL (CAAX protease family)
MARDHHFDADAPLVAVSDSKTRIRAIGLALGVVLVAILVSSLFRSAGTGALALVEMTEDGNPVIYHGMGTVLGLLGLLVVPLAYLHWYATEGLVRFRSPTRSDWVGMGVGLVVFLSVMLASELVVSTLGVETAENVAVEQGRANPSLFLLLLPVQFLLTAPAEELLYRGVVQGLFRRAYGIIPGILVASALFGLVHYPALAATETDGIFVVIAILTATGIVLGTLYEYTGNLLIPMFVHAIWNTLVFGNQYLDAVGAL